MNTIIQDYIHFKRELQKLKPWDEVQDAKTIYILDETGQTRGLEFLYTAGHGYLVVPKAWEYGASLVKKTSSYSFTGTLAYYLEEDCDAPSFLDIFNNQK